MTKHTKQFTPEAFDAMADRLTLRPSRSKDAARLVLVDGWGSTTAAKKLGVSMQTTLYMVRRFRAGPDMPGVCKCCGQSLTPVNGG